MSSLARRIARTVVRDEDGALTTNRRGSRHGGHYAGRGSKLGVVNPRDPCKPGGKRKAPKVWRAKKHAPAAKPVMVPSQREQPPREKHADKMAQKAARREEHYQWPSRNGLRLIGVTYADINRHTGKPHENKREIARRLRQRSLIPTNHYKET